MRFRRLKRAVVLVPALLMVAGIGAMAEIALYSTRTSDGPADAAIVLGAAVYTDRPSPVFEERIRHAVNLFRAGHVRLLVMTGGRGPGDRLTEAQAAREWSMGQGVPREAILLEEASRTTQENLAFALPLLRQHGIKRVLIVSDPLHMRRAMAIARHLGIEAEPSPTPTSRYVGWRVWGEFLAGETYYLTRCRVTGQC
ncbi:YdcF family protein [Microvirga sp. ACRRW]|uniref:YdcF family protein n=1 Tax=Microvirga sp. ACRRW TaxID=2918205 RepID=UPI001EF4D13A|nr:YdcF family protein [Microvirga sp. ACRRW]MCG7392306.1 YdcF family protein [Microvirga sp. ACRRW]